MKILITGASGFMGSHIAEAFVKLDEHKVYGVDDNSGGNPQNVPIGCLFTELDLRDKEKVAAYIKQVQPDVLYHLAANARECASFFQPIDVTERNLLAYINVLEPCIKYGMKKVVLFSCHDNKTRLVTKKGLKYYWEINKDDIVFSLNKKCEIEESQINEIIINEYKGKLINFKGKANLMVTPNHRMCYIKSPKLNPRLEYEIAEKSFKRSYLQCPQGKWIGKEVAINYAINKKDLAYLVGLFIADGVASYEIRRQKNKSGYNRKDFLKKRDTLGRFYKIKKRGINNFSYWDIYSIRFCIPESDRSRKKLIDILERNNLNPWSDRNVVGISSKNLKELYNIFSECGKNAHEKKIPTKWLNGDKELLKKVYEGLMDGDGDKRRMVLTTVSMKLVENCIELAIKIGKTISFKYHKREKECKLKDGRIIKGSGAYYICFGNKNQVIWKKKYNFKKFPYKGNVWCLNTNNSNFLVERRGRIAFSGNSMSRYGDQEPPFDEEYPTKPLDIYASNKVAMEEITKQLSGAHGFEWTIIVPRNVFGEKQSLKDRFRNYIAITMNHIMRNEDVIIYGDGEQVRSFSYIKNSLPCYIDCLDDCEGETINIGGLAPKTINEVAELIIVQFSGYKGKVVHLPPRHGEVKLAYATYKKSRFKLGYREKYSLEDGIALMAAWAKNQGPQEWTKDTLSLINEKVPMTWR